MAVFGWIEMWLRIWSFVIRDSLVDYRLWWSFNNSPQWPSNCPLASNIISKHTEMGNGMRTSVAALVLRLSCSRLKAFGITCPYHTTPPRALPWLVVRHRPIIPGRTLQCAARPLLVGTLDGQLVDDSTCWKQGPNPAVNNSMPLFTLAYRHISVR